MIINFILTLILFNILLIAAFYIPAHYEAHFINVVLFINMIFFALGALVQAIIYFSKI